MDPGRQGPWAIVSSKALLQKTVEKESQSSPLVSVDIPSSLSLSVSFSFTPEASHRERQAVCLFWQWRCDTSMWFHIFTSLLHPPPAVKRTL